MHKLIFVILLSFLSNICGYAMLQVDSNNIDDLILQLEETNDEQELLQLHFDIGSFQMEHTLELDKALNHFSEALEIAERQKNIELTIKLLRKIGYIQYVLGSKEKAVKYYNEALDLANSINNKKASMEIRLYLGNLFEEINDKEKAIYYYQTIANDYDPNYPSGESLATIARYHLLKEEYNEAIAYSIQALTIFNEQNNDRWVAYLYSELSLLSVELGDLDNAIEFATTGMFIANQNNLSKEKMDNYKALSQAYEKKNNFEESLKYYKLYAQFRDSIFSEKQVLNIEVLESQLNNQRKEKEILTLKREKDIQKAELKTKKIVLYSILLVSLLILIFSVVIYSRFSLIKNQKREIELKNVKLKQIYDQQGNLLKEKVTLLKEVHHRVKNNMQVINSLLVLQSNLIDDENVKEIFRVGQNRIFSMAMVHEMLYSKDDLSKIELSRYVNELIDKLSSTYSDNNKIEYHITIPTTEFDIDTAIPLGLLINEVITNSLKYAFPDQTSCIITVELIEDDDKFVLHLKDNGIGISKEKLEQMSGLGHELIESLVEQINGELKVITDQGTHYIITIKKNKPLQ